MSKPIILKPKVRSNIKGRPLKPPKTASKVVRMLVEEMEKRDISQASIAAVVGRATGTISHWKSGYGLPDILSVEVFAEALGFEIVLRKIEKPAE